MSCGLCCWVADGAQQGAGAVAAQEPLRLQGETSATAPAAPRTVHHTWPRQGVAQPSTAPRAHGSGLGTAALPAAGAPCAPFGTFVPNNRLSYWGADKETWHMGSIPLTPRLHSLPEVTPSSQLLPASACPWCACPWHAPCRAAGVRMAARPPCRVGQPLLNSFP